MKFWKVLHIIAKLAKPILAIAGVKSKTVAAKTAEAMSEADKAVSQEEPSK